MLRWSNNQRLEILLISSILEQSTLIWEEKENNHHHCIEKTIITGMQGSGNINFTDSTQSQTWPKDKYHHQCL
ncbi:hypothetical protein AQUCO_01400651v1 [Aquilegia coerulea]|uniref:Uncharacterized protein n=1 Tax=Aquilegia coerulea TaxID=218851 RepID=A0A2G5DXK9_AQUCA|nr:hypothetical protein AQUCO_01400651v1 [Aquilegia coerulea]